MMLYFDYDEEEAPEDQPKLDGILRQLGEMSTKRRLEDLLPCGCCHPYAVIQMGSAGIGYKPYRVKSACCDRFSRMVGVTLHATDSVLAFIDR